MKPTSIEQILAIWGDTTVETFVEEAPLEQLATVFVHMELLKWRIKFCLCGDIHK